MYEQPLRAAHSRLQVTSTVQRRAVLVHGWQIICFNITSNDNEFLQLIDPIITSIMIIIIELYFCVFVLFFIKIIFHFLNDDNYFVSRNW